MNRYVRYQFTQLNKNRHNPRVFWCIANTLLFKSHSYRTMCFNHVYPNWHRKFKYSVVKNILISLANLNLKSYRYKTVHIPKADGSTRPLGVPSPAWRVFLHGLNNILLVWLSPYLHPSQHGFRPGRGTLTAWQELMRKTNYNSIYEFDMTKFFDSVNLHYLEKILLITKIPKYAVDLIIRWNQTLPSNSPRHGITWKNPLEEASDYKYSRTGKPLIGHTDYAY
jgi:retron-type reverse transcriptase